MSSEKTEKPTQKKIDDAREKGQVAQSKDIQIVIKLGAFYALFFYINDGYTARFSALVDAIVEQGFLSKNHFINPPFSMAVEIFFLIVTPILGVCVLAALVGTWSQIGFLIAPEAIVPSMKKFDAVSNIKNMLSKKSLVQLLLSLCKVIVLAWIACMVFQDAAKDMVYSYQAGLNPWMSILNKILQRMVFYSLGIFLIMALIDWTMERTSLMKNLRMSHQDIKDEHKQTQGNPEIKQKRKSLHRNLLNASLSKVPSAKVVVANPTHISVALDYEPGKHDLPYVLTMGIDADALLIQKKAKEAGIPIIRNVELARMIYKDCEEEEYIKREHLELAAEVFRAVMEMNGTNISAQE